MSEAISPVVIVGPTTVGKSEVANELADRFSAVLINADKYGLYQRPEFAIGFGLAPGEIDDARERELYGVLDPTDPLPSPSAYAEMAADAVDRVHSLGKLAVIEGCSYRYNMALIGRFGVERAVNLTWAAKDGLEAKVAERAQSAFKWGLLDETQHALDAGLDGTVPMTSMLYRPALEVLNGTIDIDEAIRRASENGLDNALEHDQWYSEVPDLWRIAHDRKQVGLTVDAIAEHFNLG